MFAPALVGAVMPLSVAAFERCTSQLLNPGGLVVEGRLIPLLAVKSEEAPWQQLYEPQHSRTHWASQSAVAGVDQRAAEGWGRAGLRIQAEGSVRNSAWREASRPLDGGRRFRGALAATQEARSSTGLEACAGRARI
jgi:hypothetical protein